MSFLKAIGKGLVKAFGFLGSHAGEIGLVAPFLPAGAVADIFGVIMQVEIIGANRSMTGPEKYAAAYHAVQFELSKRFPGRITDQALHDKAVAALTQGAVDLLNSLDGPPSTP